MGAASQVPAEGLALWEVKGGENCQIIYLNDVYLELELGGEFHIDDLAHQNT